MFQTKLEQKMDEDNENETNYDEEWNVASKIIDNEPFARDLEKYAHELRVSRTHHMARIMARYAFINNELKPYTYYIIRRQEEDKASAPFETTWKAQQISAKIPETSVEESLNIIRNHLISSIGILVIICSADPEEFVDDGVMINDTVMKHYFIKMESILVAKDTTPYFKICRLCELNKLFYDRIERYKNYREKMQAKQMPPPVMPPRLLQPMPDIDKATQAPVKMSPVKTSSPPKRPPSPSARVEVAKSSDSPAKDLAHKKFEEEFRKRREETKLKIEKEIEMKRSEIRTRIENEIREKRQSLMKDVKNAREAALSEIFGKKTEKMNEVPPPPPVTNVERITWKAERVVNILKMENLQNTDIQKVIGSVVTAQRINDTDNSITIDELHNKIVAKAMAEHDLN